MNAAIKLLTESQAAQTIVLSGSGSGILSLGNAGDSLLFIGSMAIAVRTGGFIYFVDGEYTSSQMRTINSYARAEDSPLVRVSSSQFDFLVGSTLTKAGLPLTHRDSQDQRPSPAAPEGRE